MKYKELKKLPKEDLKSKILELKKELIKENVQISTGTVPKSPGKIRTMKKTIAKINAILEEK